MQPQQTQNNSLNSKQLGAEEWFNGFKKSLGKKGLSMSDNEIKDLYHTQSKLADILLDRWLVEEKSVQEMYNKVM